MNYSAKLSARIQQTHSALCVGLDPRPDSCTVPQLEHFLKNLIEEVTPFTACFKPNMAYFEALGVAGVQLLENILTFIPKDIPIILDAKRGDIGETQRYYAKCYFDLWDVDAVTLNPFMGYDILEPFLQYEGKGVYLLGVTSNKGSADIECQRLADGRYVYELVGDMVARAKAEACATDLGLVLGLTNATEDVLNRLPDVPLLIPGLGAQGGDLAALSGAGRSAASVINVSRGIMYAEPERSHAAKAEDYAMRIRKALQL